MSDNWFVRGNPTVGGIGVTTAADDRCMVPPDTAERGPEDDCWPPGARILFMVGAAAFCWAIIGLAVYLLW